MLLPAGRCTDSPCPPPQLPPAASRVALGAGISMDCISMDWPIAVHCHLAPRHHSAASPTLPSMTFWGTIAVVSLKARACAARCGPDRRTGKQQLAPWPGRHMHAIWPCGARARGVAGAPGQGAALLFRWRMPRISLRLGQCFRSLLPHTPGLDRPASSLPGVTGWKT